jgi:hypothetical protein
MTLLTLYLISDDRSSQLQSGLKIWLMENGSRGGNLTGVTVCMSCLLVYCLNKTYSINKQ